MKTHIFLHKQNKDKKSVKVAFTKFIEKEKVNLGKLSLSIVFGSVDAIDKDIITDIYKATNKANMIGCSTGGEIYDSAYEKSILVILLEDFGEVLTKGNKIKGSAFNGAIDLGKEVKNFGKFNLGFVFSDGLIAESEDIVRGLQKELGDDATLFGGFSGDDGKFTGTYQFINGEIIEKGIVIALIKTNIKISTAWEHGYQPLGLGRKVTTVKDGKVVSIEDKSTLDFYRDYLDEEEVLKMPLLGHHYPLGITKEGKNDILIRAIFDANQKDGSCVIRGTKCSEGDIAHVMLGQKKKVLKSAVKAASDAMAALKKPELAILINCFGRKMVYSDDYKNEIAEIKKEIGNIPLVGFYCYGEISPVSGKSEYHNLTTNILVLGN